MENVFLFFLLLLDLTIWEAPFVSREYLEEEKGTLVHSVCVMELGCSNNGVITCYVMLSWSYHVGDQ